MLLYPQKGEMVDPEGDRWLSDRRTNVMSWWMWSDKNNGTFKHFMKIYGTCKTLWMCVLLHARVFIWAPHCVAGVACVILRHSCKKCCFASHFLPERLKIETFMLSECTFPSGSVQLWVSAIGRTPSRGHLLPRLPLAGTCGGSVRKSFSDRTQEPRGAAGNWEKDNVGATRRAVVLGGFERRHHRDCEWGCWDATSQHSKGQDDHMVIGTGEDNDSQQWHSESTCHKPKLIWHFTVK